MTGKCAAGDGRQAGEKPVRLFRIWLIVVALMIIYFSDRPDLRVEYPATWFNPPAYRHVTLGYFFDPHSEFYEGYRNWTATEFILHKIGHIVGYAALTHCANHSVRPERRRLWRIWAGVALFALSDEIHQSFVVERDGRLWDVGIDSAVSALTLFWMRRRRRMVGRIHSEGRPPGGSEGM